MVGAATTSLRWDALPPPWVVLLVLLPLLVLLVRFLYRREAGKVGRRPRMVMGGLRVLAILLVCGALFGPYLERIEGKSVKRHLVLCLDTSGSMSFPDVYRSNPELRTSLESLVVTPGGESLKSLSRLEIARRLLGGDRRFLERLAEKFRLEIYGFDGEAHGLFVQADNETPAMVADRILAVLPTLKAEGGVTRIGATIRHLVRRLDARNEPVAGILLFTDGRHTGGAPDPIDEARRAAEGTREGIPIFPVAIGDPTAAVNISTSRIDAPEFVLAGDEVSFTATVHARGLKGQSASLVAEVLDPFGQVLYPLPIDAVHFALPGDGQEPVKISFRHRFAEHGTYDLRIGVPPDANEAVTSDNWQRHILSVVKLKMKVLYVSTMPTPTFRFLNVALMRAEEEIVANSILLSAELNWPQEASRGVEPLDEFPREKAKLAPFDVIILGDVDPRSRRFSGGGDTGLRDTLAMLAAWVKEGGGLVLQSSADDFLPGAYEGTQLMELLPVIPSRTMTAERRAQLIDTGAEKRYKLTPAGLAHPILRILRDPQETQEFWEGTGFGNANFYYWYFPVERAKSSATVLAVRRESERIPLGDGFREPDPLIVLQDYGLGKVLWLGVDELWRMRRRVESLYFWRFWSGVIRHLATYRLLGGNKRIKIWVDRPDGHYAVDDTVGIEAKYLDENFEPVPDSEGEGGPATRTLKLQMPDGSEEEVALQAAGGDPPEGLFRGKYLARRPGTYRLVAEAGVDEEPAKATFVVAETTIEMRDPLMDMRTLNEIAQASRGRVLSPSDFRRLLDPGETVIPPAAIVRTGEPQRTDLWDNAWVLWAFVALLAAEWILRRLHLLL